MCKHEVAGWLHQGPPAESSVSGLITSYADANLCLARRIEEIVNLEAGSSSRAARLGHRQRPSRQYPAGDHDSEAHGDQRATDSQHRDKRPRDEGADHDPADRDGHGESVRPGEDVVVEHVRQGGVGQNLPNHEPATAEQ